MAPKRKSRLVGTGIQNNFHELPQNEAIHTSKRNEYKRIYFDFIAILLTFLLFVLQGSGQYLSPSWFLDNTWQPTQVSEDLRDSPHPGSRNFETNFLSMPIPKHHQIKAV